MNRASDIKCNKMIFKFFYIYFGRFEIYSFRNTLIGKNNLVASFYIWICISELFLFFLLLSNQDSTNSSINRLTLSGDRKHVDFF